VHAALVGDGGRRRVLGSMVWTVGLDVLEAQAQLPVELLRREREDPSTRARRVRRSTSSGPVGAASPWWVVPRRATARMRATSSRKPKGYTT